METVASSRGLPEEDREALIAAETKDEERCRGEVTTPLSETEKGQVAINDDNNGMTGPASADADAAEVDDDDADDDEEVDAEESEYRYGEDEEDEEELEEGEGEGGEECDNYNPDEQATPTATAGVCSTVKIGNKSIARSCFIPNDALKATETKKSGKCFTFCETARPHNILTCKKLHLRSRGVLIDSIYYVRINMMLENEALLRVLREPAKSKEVKLCTEEHDCASCDGVHVRPEVIFVGSPGFKIAYFEPELHANIGLTRLKREATCLTDQCGSWCKNRHSHDIVTCSFLHYKRDGNLREKPRMPGLPQPLIPSFNPYRMLPRKPRAGAQQHGRGRGRGRGGRGNSRGNRVDAPLPETLRRGHIDRSDANKRDRNKTATADTTTNTTAELRDEKIKTQVTEKSTTPSEKTRGNNISASTVRATPATTARQRAAVQKGKRSLQDLLLIFLVVAVAVVSVLLFKS